MNSDRFSLTISTADDTSYNVLTLILKSPMFLILNSKSDDEPGNCFFSYILTSLALTGDYNLMNNNKKRFCRKCKIQFFYRPFL